MANVPNKITGKLFQDDLDAMLDGINPEQTDEFSALDHEEERLLPNKSLGKVEPILKKEQNHELKMDKFSKPSDNANTEKKDIDSLLDDITEEGYTGLYQPKAAAKPAFDFDEFDSLDDIDETASNVINAKPDNVVKLPTINPLDDFEAFDEFGEIDHFENELRTIFPDEAKATESPDIEPVVTALKPDADEFEALIDDYDDMDFDAKPEAGLADLDKTGSAIMQKSIAPVDLDELDLIADEHMDEAPTAELEQISAIVTSTPDLDELLDFEPLSAEAGKTEEDDDELKTMAEMMQKSKSSDVGQNLENADVSAELALTSESALTDWDDFTDDIDSTTIGKINPYQERQTDDTLDEHFDIMSEADEFDDPSYAAHEPSELVSGLQKHDDESFSEISHFEDQLQANESESIAAVDTTVKHVEPMQDIAFQKEVSELWAAHNIMKLQLDKYSENAEDPLERQAKERRERKELLEIIDKSGKKVPTLTYVAAGLGGLALLLGSGMLVMGGGAISDVKELKDHYATIEEDLAVLKLGSGAPTAGKTGGADFHAAIEQVETQMKQLQQQLTTIDKSSQIGELQSSVETIKKELDQGLKHKMEALEKSQSNLLASKSAIAKSPVVEVPKPEKSIRVIAAVDKDAEAPAINTKKPSVQSPSSHWVANLVSFRQDWYANRKIEEFAKKGITASVMTVDVKGETWYLLRSTGFATQEEALKFANKAKRTLNLTSVLVTQDE